MPLEVELRTQLLKHLSPHGMCGSGRGAHGCFHKYQGIYQLCSCHQGCLTTALDLPQSAFE